MAVIHFADGNKPKTQIFEKGIATPEGAIEIAEYFDGGGTVFEPWMKKTLALIEDSKFNKADVICITDGLTNISNAMMSQWRQTKAAREMRAFGILIGTRQGAATLASITDAMLTLDNMKDDEQNILQSIFSI
jgi:uncharacterized protein with von Willebrand factor type A (vWA) domain